MRPRHSRSLVALLILAGVSFSGAARAEEPAHPKPLPPAIVQAWAKAGAEAGWIKVSAFGWHEFRSLQDESVGDLFEFNVPGPTLFTARPKTPGFRVAEWKPGLLTGLAPPPEAFGLDL
jgi:hypothetical protein